MADRQKLESLERNLQERQWGIKNSSSTPVHILQTRSRLFHSVLDWVLQEVDTKQNQKSKRFLRENAYEEERGVRESHQIVMQV